MIMKLLSIKQARSIWLIYLLELNPRGRNPLPLISAMIAKYNFLQSPGKPEEFDLSKGVKFGNGSFQKGVEHEIVIDLTFFNDGIIADTRSSTKDSDAFLDEFLNWISGEFWFVPYREIIRKKLYLSELFIQTDRTLNTLNPKLERFVKHLNSVIVGHENHPIGFEATGIMFGTDPRIINSPGPFKF